MVLKYLLVLLSDSSASFCYYPSQKAEIPKGIAVANSHKKDNAFHISDEKPTEIYYNEKQHLISLDHLKKTVVFALKNNLKVNFLYPHFLLDEAYTKVIEEVEHIKIIPFDAKIFNEDAILIIDSKDFPTTLDLENYTHQNFILKLQKKDLKKLDTMILALLAKSARINLVLMDVENYEEKEYAIYEKQLEKITRNLIQYQNQNAIPELNFLTDRIDLNQMNNCQAGIQHLTIAPNGKMYLCPAFYYENPSEDLGEIKNEIFIKNSRLLELNYAPICRICDAYQCKRCVYLNKKLTLEINTPSSQQCITSHIERDASRRILEKLQKMHPDFNPQITIPQLNYRDPFEIVKGNPQKIATLNHP
ncbi:MAG: CXXX repeat peptide maturase [Flavobacteriaceae bacterium]|nr:CXXX repeat peptide maturase [Flavobacteriaceae bacterium]